MLGWCNCRSPVSLPGYPTGARQPVTRSPTRLVAPDRLGGEALFEFFDFEDQFLLAHLDFSFTDR